MGSEMCIRDRLRGSRSPPRPQRVGGCTPRRRAACVLLTHSHTLETKQEPILKEGISACRFSLALRLCSFVGFPAFHTLQKQPSVTSFIVACTYPSCWPSARPGFMLHGVATGRPASLARKAGSTPASSSRWRVCGSPLTEPSTTHLLHETGSMSGWSRRHPTRKRLSLIHI